MNEKRCFECFYVHVPTDKEPCKICDNSVNVKCGEKPTFKFFESARTFCGKHIVAKLSNGLWKEGNIGHGSLEFESFNDINKISDVKDIDKYYTFDDFVLYKYSMSIMTLSELRPYLLKKFGVQKMFIKKYKEDKK